PRAVRARRRTSPSTLLRRTRTASAARKPTSPDRSRAQWRADSEASEKIAAGTFCVCRYPARERDGFATERQKLRQAAILPLHPHAGAYARLNKGVLNMLERIVRSLVIASAILGASGAFAADLSSNTCNRHR